MEYFKLIDGEGMVHSNLKGATERTLKLLELRTKPIYYKEHLYIAKDGVKITDYLGRRQRKLNWSEWKEYVNWLLGNKAIVVSFFVISGEELIEKILWDGCSFLNIKGERTYIPTEEIGLFKMSEICETVEELRKIEIWGSGINWMKDWVSTVEYTMKYKSALKNKKDFESMKEKKWLYGPETKTSPISYMADWNVDDIVFNVKKIDLKRAYTTILSQGVPAKRTELKSWWEWGYFTYIRVIFNKGGRLKNHFFNPFKKQLSSSWRKGKEIITNNFSLIQLLEITGLTLEDCETQELESWRIENIFPFLKEFREKPQKIFKRLPNFFNGLCGVEKEKDQSKFVLREGKWVEEREKKERKSHRQQIYNYVVSRCNAIMFQEAKNVGWGNVLEMHTDSLTFINKNDHITNLDIFKEEILDGTLLGKKLFKTREDLIDFLATRVERK